jgi:hypothetical protein
LNGSGFTVTRLSHLDITNDYGVRQYIVFSFAGFKFFVN